MLMRGDGVKSQRYIHCDKDFVSVFLTRKTTSGYKLHTGPSGAVLLDVEMELQNVYARTHISTYLINSKTWHSHPPSICSEYIKQAPRTPAMLPNPQN